MTLEAGGSIARTRIEWQALAWLLLFAAVGGALVVLYPDSSSADGGTHFLQARWALAEQHHSLLVDVWGRPLFTALYALPSYLLGYRAAKLFTVAISLACAWQSWRTAQLLRLDRAALVVPLLLVQPTFLMVTPETMTEPLFALVFIVALRLHLEGRVRIGAVLASLLPLARPEGPFLVALWGLWIILDRRDARVWWRRIPDTLPLATGMILWWLAALAITHDPLWIRHNAPWQLTSAAASHGDFWHYWTLRSEILGPYLWLPVVIGMATLVYRRILAPVTAVLVIFLLHSTMWAFGLFNTEGYPRYLSCVAPALALLALAGWNLFADAAGWAFSRSGWPRVGQWATVLVSAYVLLYSGWYAVMYVDGQVGSRVAWAMRDSYQWFEAHPRPVRQLVWSRAYMPILFDWDFWKNPAFTDSRDHNVELLRNAGSGTLVFWDGGTGKEWYHLEPDDIVSAGYVELRSRSYSLYPLIPGRAEHHYEGPLLETLYLFYKE